MQCVEHRLDAPRRGGDSQHTQLLDAELFNVVQRGDHVATRANRLRACACSECATATSLPQPLPTFHFAEPASAPNQSPVLAETNKEKVDAVAALSAIVFKYDLAVAAK